MTNINLLEFLQAELPSKVPAKKDLISPEGFSGEVAIRPIPVKIRNLSVDQALAKTVNTEELRPAMCGIYQCAQNKHKVTTNGHYLIVIPDGSIHEAKVVRPSTGQTIDEKFPDYGSVIPFLDLILVMDKPKEILDRLQGLCRASKFLTEPIRVRFLVDGVKEIFLDPNFLKTALTALMETGTTSIHVEVSSEDKPRPVILRDANDHRKFAMVMPVMGEDFLFTTLLEGQTQAVPLSKRIDHISQLYQSALSEISWEMKYHHQALAKDVHEHDEFGIEYHKIEILEACLKQQSKINDLKMKLVELYSQQDTEPVGF